MAVLILHWDVGLGLHPQRLGEGLLVQAAAVNGTPDVCCSWPQSNTVWPCLSVLS